MSLPTVCFIIGAPIDGDFGDWEAWGQCSHTCGESFRSRKRKCDNPAPQNGGRDCDLRWSTEIIRCNVTNCPGISFIQNLGKNFSKITTKKISYAYTITISHRNYEVMNLGVETETKKILNGKKKKK